MLFHPFLCLHPAEAPVRFLTRRFFCLSISEGNNFLYLWAYSLKLFALSVRPIANSPPFPSIGNVEINTVVEIAKRSLIWLWLGNSDMTDLPFSVRCLASVKGREMLRRKHPLEVPSQDCASQTSLKWMDLLFLFYPHAWWPKTC